MLNIYTYIFSVLLLVQKGKHTTYKALLLNVFIEDQYSILKKNIHRLK
jgi:hypothetical protein